MVDKNITNAGKLLTLFVKLHKERYNRPLVVNRYKEKWKMVDVIESVGYDRAVELMHHYFKTNNPGHPIDKFVYNFEKYDSVMRELEVDRVNRENLRRITEQRVRELEERQYELRTISD